MTVFVFYKQTVFFSWGGTDFSRYLRQGCRTETKKLHWSPKISPPIECSTSPLVYLSTTHMEIMRFIVKTMPVRNAAVYESNSGFRMTEGNNSFDWSWHAVRSIDEIQSAVQKIRQNSRLIQEIFHYLINVIVLINWHCVFSQVTIREQRRSGYISVHIVILTG